MSAVAATPGAVLGPSYQTPPVDGAPPYVAPNVTGPAAAAPLTVPREHLDAAQAGLDGLRQQAIAGDDAATRPSFWQKALEVFEFILRCLPGIGQIVSMASAAIRLCRIALALLSGEDKEHIDWTKELTRLSGDLLGIIMPLGGAIANAGLNYWFDAQSDTRQGVQILGGLNYLAPESWELGPNRRGVVRDTLDMVRRQVAGVISSPTQPYVDPYATGLQPQPGLDGTVTPGGAQPVQVVPFAPAAV